MNPNQDKAGRDDLLDRDIQAVLREETAEIDPDEGLERFMAAVAANPKPQSSWWQRMNSWLGAVGFSPALASVVVMVQVGVIAALLATQPRPAADAAPEVIYRGITGQGHEAPDLKLTINPDTDFASLATLLRANGCRIVAGPSELGEIWVVVDDKANLPAIRKSLEESKLIDDVATHQ